MNLRPKDFELIKKCPWDSAGEEQFKYLYTDYFGCDIVKCNQCGLVFAKKRLNKTGLSEYWGDYLSREHIKDKIVVSQRYKMYQIDYHFINSYIKMGKVLDVGCGNGSFMTLFENAGYDVMGLEYGKEAYEAARTTHNVKYGSLPDIEFSNRFDLIIFRGVLQYTQNPIQYLEKAISLLNPRGYIFITAQPNVESFCFRLYGVNFTQPVTAADCIGYTSEILTKFFEKNNFSKVGEKYFYEETPYADVENDVLKVADAIRKRRNGEQIMENSPAFWGNMMSLIYQRR